MPGSAHRWSMNAVNEPMVRAEFDPFPPAADEVVVEIAGCGVCHTDLGFIYDGVRLNHDLPLALGHEISGRDGGARRLAGPRGMPLGRRQTRSPPRKDTSTRGISAPPRGRHKASCIPGR